MKKIGILGGGQLGRMLLQAAANYAVETYVLETDEHCPSAHLCTHFVKGNLQNYDEVLAFGKLVDVLTIEIEHVNVEALEALEQQGVQVIPSAAAIRTIQNKILQKQLYTAHGIPTADYIITQTAEELTQHQAFLPAVHKLAKGGYDGKGVQVLNNQESLTQAFNEPAVLEKKVAIQQELALIVAVSTQGETAVYPLSEMVFNPYLNLLDFQISPARVSQEVLWKAEAIAIKVVKALKSPGLFAVELFVDANNEVLVNEVAPRVHNSGHHSIEGNACSQFDMLLRILLHYPLGNTQSLSASCLVNVLGAPNHAGPAVYQGLEDVLKMDGVYVHLYGKTHTKPGRKMGHITILDKDRTALIHKANKVKDFLKVITQ
ncbi:MAG: 5-(carboxyamino)imidazole ribonucleotide synthase [Bacteroidetes bacterium]|nr:MAG: 5-(carboxyamino)imidazole ribonucleotide synthase [Bacteroidota bacterium]